MLEGLASQNLGFKKILVLTLKMKCTQEALLINYHHNFKVDSVSLRNWPMAHLEMLF